MLTLLPAAPPIHCDAERLLLRAREAFDRGFYVEAGALMREAMRSKLTSLFEYHGCKLPRRKVRRTAGELAILLEREGKITKDTATWALELLEIGNRAVHCRFVTRRELSTAIAMAGYFAAEDNA